MPASNDRSSSSQAADGSSAEPLGLKHPLLPAPALGQRVLMPQFTTPLGARSLMPGLSAVPEYAPAVSFDDSPFFAVSRSSLSIQPKRSSVAPLLMDAPSAIQPIRQPIREEGIRDRGLLERSTLQRFSEPLPSQISPTTGDEAPTIPTTAIKPDSISDGTVEATGPLSTSPLTETGIDPSTSDLPESDGLQSQPLPAAIEPSSIVHPPSQQGLTEFGADQSVEHGEGDSVSSPSIQRSSEVAAPTPELTLESASPPSTDSIANLPSHTNTPSGADTQETVPSHTPIIQPRLEETPAAVAPMNSPGEMSQPDALPQAIPSSASEIASPDASLGIASHVLPQPADTPLPAALPVSSLAPPEASPPKLQPRLDSSPVTPQPHQPPSIQKSVHNETALFSGIPAQETPEQNASPLQQPVDALPMENLDVPANQAIAPTSDALTDATSPTIQTRLEATANNFPPTQIIPETVDSAIPTPVQHSSEQASDAAVDAIPFAEQPKGVMPEASISPVLQRSPTEQATHQQAPALLSNDSPSDAVQLQSEPTEGTIASTEDVSSLPPHSSPTVERSFTVAPMATPTVESPQLEHSPIPSLTVSPQDSNSEGATLQRKHAEFNSSIFQTPLEPESGQVESIQASTPFPVADTAIPFTREAAIPTFSNLLDESRSAPPIPTRRDASPSPIAPQDTLAAASPSPQPVIQRQPAPDVVASPASLPEPQRDDRTPIPTQVQSNSITHGDTTMQAENPFVADPNTIGVSSRSVTNDTAAEATSTEATVVQAYPEQRAFPSLPKALQNLTTLNPLGNANPLVQPSLLIPQTEATPSANLQRKAVQPVPEASSNQPLHGSLTQVVERQTEPRVQVPPIAPQMGNQFSPLPSVPPSQRTNTPIKQAPDAWSSIDELLGRSPTLPAIQRFVDKPPTDDSFNLNQQDAHRFDPFQGYQPLSDRPPTGVPSMDSPNEPTELPSIADKVPARTEGMDAGETQADAQANQAFKPKDEAEKLDELAREIYQLLRQRFEIERERHGNYYPDRF